MQAWNSLKGCVDQRKGSSSPKHLSGGDCLTGGTEAGWCLQRTPQTLGVLTVLHGN